MAIELIDEKAIFNSARCLATPDERAAYLKKECGHDPEAHRRILDLLHVYDQSQSFLESPAPVLDVTFDAPQSVEQSGTHIGPYKLVEPIGEGGMGAVWLAQQTEPIKRLVAVKLIKAGMDSKQVIARFEAERQALALMDHPNIAKVLDGGATGTGRPYFVMDLVKGTPITQYCDEHHLTPRQRLELFVPICQAVQHAHQKGIIHRDLKPSNVLVALYDSKPVPKVIDFGVAKAAGQPLTDKTLVTGIGNIVGTLEYMSPEQAEVNQLDIDTRSDIYSLGVLLYELLAGSPPFTKKELEKAGVLEMLRVIREQEPSKPSTKLCSSDALPTLSANRGTEPARLTKLIRGELDWIVMKALDKDRSRRYETANGFAMDVQRYLADEPVQACPPSVGYRLRKFARRNKSKVAFAGVVLVFLLLLGVGVGYTLSERASRQARVATQVEFILADTDHLMKEQKWPEALAAARRAEAVLAGDDAGEATRRRVGELLKDLAFVERLEQIRMERATIVEGEFNDAEAIREYGQAFREYGVDVEVLPVETAIAHLKARPAISIPLAAALDDWVSAQRVVARQNAAGWKRLVAIARGIDTDSLRDRLRAVWGQPITPERQADLRRLAESIDVRSQHPATLLALAATLGRVQLPDVALQILQEAQRAHPDDFWLTLVLADLLSNRKDYEEAIRYYTAAMSIRPNAAVTQNDLGLVLRDRGKLDEAIACYRTAIHLEPKNALPHNNLGGALYDQKKLDEAIACYRRAIELDPKYAPAHSNLGNALRDQKKLDEAIASHHQAIALDPKLAAAHTNLGTALQRQGKLDDAIAFQRKAIELDPKYAPAHSNLGNALYAQGKLDEAIACYRKAIEVDPKYVIAHTNLGIALRDQKKLDEAIASTRRAIALDPKDASAHFNLGTALHDLKKLDEAVASYRRAIELDPKDAPVHFNLGNALLDQKKADEAIACYRNAIALDPNLARVHNNLGKVLRDHGKLDEAIACLRKAIELDPKGAVAHTNLANALHDQGKFDEAITCYRTAVEFDPKDFLAHHNLGIALVKQGKVDEAVVCYRNAITLNPKDATVHFELGVALQRQRKLDEAIVCFRKVIELNPRNVKAQLNLGFALSRKGRLDEAVPCLRTAIALDPESFHGHYNLGIALKDQGKLDEAIGCLRKAVELDPRSFPAHTNLGGALLKVPEKLDEAIRCFRKAIELDPRASFAHDNLGIALRMYGKPDEAITCFRKAIELDPKNATPHNNLAWTLANCPDSKLRDFAAALRLAEEATRLAPTSARNWSTLGVARYRAGDWKGAVEAIDRSGQLVNDNSAFAGFFLAMAHHRLGQKEVARQCYEQTVAWMEKHFPQREELLRSRAEAEELLEIKKK